MVPLQDATVLMVPTMMEYRQTARVTDENAVDNVYFIDEGCPEDASENTKTINTYTHKEREHYIFTYLYICLFSSRLSSLLQDMRQHRNLQGVHGRQQVSECAHKYV